MNKLIKVRSLNDLYSFLQHEGVPLDKYGVGTTRTVKQLYEEIQLGESLLEFNTKHQTISRRVKIINARVYYNFSNGETQLLSEDKQIFKNKDYERKRTHLKGCSFSEKFKKGESPLEALFRGFKEELGLTLEKNQFQRKKECEEIICSFSETYPGIISMYETCFFDIELTEKQYSPGGYKEVCPEKTTYFKWKEL